MRRPSIVPFVLLAAAACSPGRTVAINGYPGPPPADTLLTRAERSGFRETSRYEDVITYLQGAAAQTPLTGRAHCLPS